MSRMDRYYKNNTYENKRSRMNQELYRSIYSTDEYSNIEGIATMDKTNEIDLSKIKGMLKSREEFNSQKEYRQLFKKVDEPVLKEEVKSESDEKNFDINCCKFVEQAYKAKSWAFVSDYARLKIIYDYGGIYLDTDVELKVKNQKQEDEKYRSVDNTNYNLLKELKIQDRKREIEENQTELKELVDTITNTKALNKMDDSELSLSVFDDLKASEHTIANSKSIQKILDEAKNESKTNEMSNSFYTKSLNFSKKDLQEYEDSKEEKKKKRKIKILVACILLISLSAIAFMLYKFIF